MKKQKLSVRSVRSVNMADTNYMILHNRMYVVYDSLSIPHIHLHTSSPANVSIALSDRAAKDFLSYEMKFSNLLAVFSSLCIKFGELPF